MIDAVRNAHTRETTFFTNEFRSPVLVDDIVRVCARLIELDQEIDRSQCIVWNMGGSTDCSRFELAAAIVRKVGDPAALKGALQQPVDGVERPQDIRMNSTRLYKALGFSLRGYEEGVEFVLG
jgi:dTDP-4-dehydrorhamnose reductase